MDIISVFEQYPTKTCYRYNNRKNDNVFMEVLENGLV